MIIREIHIDGFGIFNEFSIKNLDKGINILAGENEAGKSNKSGDRLRDERLKIFNLESTGVKSLLCDPSVSELPKRRIPSGLIL